MKSNVLAELIELIENMLELDKVRIITAKPSKDRFGPVVDLGHVLELPRLLDLVLLINAKSINPNGCDVPSPEFLQSLV